MAEKDIFDELKELQEKQSALEGVELVDDLDGDTPIEEPVFEEAPLEDEPAAPIEEPQEEVKPTPPPVEKPIEETPDAAAFARMRRKLAALEAKKDAQSSAQKEQTNEDAQAQLTAVLGDVIRTVQEQKAAGEFALMESEFAAQVPDYEDITAQYKAKLYDNIKFANPRASHYTIMELTKKALLNQASLYLQQGLDPILEMYEDAKAYGFKKQEPVVEQKAEIVPERRPDLAKVAANRARNAGTVGAPGAGQGGRLTREQAAALDPAQWMRLPETERERILGGM